MLPANNATQCTTWVSPASAALHTSYELHFNPFLKRPHDRKRPVTPGCCAIDSYRTSGAI